MVFHIQPLHPHERIQLWSDERDWLKRAKIGVLSPGTWLLVMHFAGFFAVLDPGRRLRRQGRLRRPDRVGASVVRCCTRP